MSDCERITQVAHDKWANVSDSLRSLRTNEQIAHFSLSLTKNERFAKKIRKKSYFLYVFYRFFWSFLKNQTICSFFLSKVSNSLRLLRRNKRLWGNRSGRSPKLSKWTNRSLCWANCSLARFFALKFDEPIPNPDKYKSTEIVPSLLLTPPYILYVQLRMCNAESKKMSAKEDDRICNSISNYSITVCCSKVFEI